jgi:fluoride exporter
MTLWSLTYVAVGGAFGAMCRYILMTLTTRFIPSNFPYGTFAVNILGAFLMGVWIAVMANMLPARGKDLHLLVAVGFLGGFTTFSTFTIDVFLMMEKGMMVESVLYVIGSFLVSLLALIAGMYLIRLSY